MRQRQLPRPLLRIDVSPNRHDGSDPAEPVQDSGLSDVARVHDGVTSGKGAERLFAGCRAIRSLGRPRVWSHAGTVVEAHVFSIGHTVN